MTLPSLKQVQTHIHLFAAWKDYLEVCKPKVVATMLFTALVGMLLATPGTVSWDVIFAVIVGIGLVAGAAAALNQVADHHIDAIMQRTRNRPLPTGNLEKKQVLIFAAVIGGAGTLILIIWANILTAVLTLLSLVGYAVIYTRYLKYATPQNIVIGGAAGATPPLLGWVAVTGHLETGAILLFLIIFAWTPPHFWALALYRLEDYKNVKVPMLPVTHGKKLTCLHILLYTILLTVITVLPYTLGMSGLLYLCSALALDAVFIYCAIWLQITQSMEWAHKLFIYSIIYLLLLFSALLLDAYIPLLTV